MGKETAIDTGALDFRNRDCWKNVRRWESIVDSFSKIEFWEWKQDM